MSGMYTTYIKADSLAERAASIEAAQTYDLREKEVPMAQLKAPEQNVGIATVCILENTSAVLRTIIGRVTSQNSTSRRCWRIVYEVSCALYIVFFCLKCWCIEEILCVCEKQYRVALMKYIHDIDGKKRIACLT